MKDKENIKSTLALCFSIAAILLCLLVFALWAFEMMPHSVITAESFIGACVAWLGVPAVSFFPRNEFLTVDVVLQQQGKEFKSRSPRFVKILDNAIKSFEYSAKQNDYEGQMNNFDY